MSASPDYRVALDVYNGPLDLLLFLIKRDEVDIYDIPIAHITQQYLEYVDVINQLDPDAAGVFLVLAATLMEIKSRLLLPKPPIEEDDDDILDPRLELVRQLLEYKKFKDAARTLEARADEQSQKHPRKPVLPEDEEQEYELENLDVWNLFEAFNTLLKQIGVSEYKHKIGIDDTPIALHAEDVLDSLERADGRQAFEEIFGGRDRGEMIGLFLALLELIRQRRVRCTQDRPFASIQIVLLDRTPLDEVPDFDTEVDEDEPEETDRPFSLHPAEKDGEPDDDAESVAADDELAAIEKALDDFEDESAKSPAELPVTLDAARPDIDSAEVPNIAEGVGGESVGVATTEQPGKVTARPSDTEASEEPVPAAIETPDAKAREMSDDTADPAPETTERSNEAQ